MVSTYTLFSHGTCSWASLKLIVSAAGIQKVSPIRRARPDEDRPRRPQIDRAQHRRLLRAATQPAFVEPPPADPPAPEIVWPRIPLPPASYETARLLMTTSREARPAYIPWTDILNLFRDIGFEAGEGRNSRGGLQVFSPSAALRQSQVSSYAEHVPVALSVPHPPDGDPLWAPSDTVTILQC